MASIPLQHHNSQCIVWFGCLSKISCLVHQLSPHMSGLTGGDCPKPSSHIPTAGKDGAGTSRCQWWTRYMKEGVNPYGNRHKILL